MIKMNSIFNKVCTLAVAALVASCNLDTQPSDFVAPETFYRNESDCTMALAGVYSTLTEEAIYGSYYCGHLSNIDDLSYWFRQNLANNIQNNSVNSSNNDLYNIWSKLYGGINNANVLLDKIDGANIDEKVKTRIKGEAKFLRAYYHFLLVQAFYEVPLRTETVKDITISSQAATPHAEAIDWCISEMEECLDMVDDSNYDRSPSHVKKNNIAGILARVYLWKAGVICNGGKEAYQKAGEYAKMVYNSRKHQLNPDVYTLWQNLACDKYDTQYNESLWEAEFIGSRDDGNYTNSRIGNELGNFQQNASSSGKGYSYGFYCSTLVLWDLFSEDDQRRDLSIAPYYLNAKDQMVEWKTTQLVDRRCGKYRREWETTYPKQKNYTPYNYCILRYADVLLMLAEAENEVNQGPTALAYECVNAIRTRAGIDEVSGLNYEGFKELVRDERARELCFESTRKYDLVRWGIYYSRIKDVLGAAVKDSRWSTVNNAKGCAQFVSNTEQKHIFMPIPMKELSVNLLLKQNKYWE